VFYVFHTYVAKDVAKVDADVACVCYGLQVFLGVFASVSDISYKCFHLDVAKVDLVLNILQWVHLP
jgi:hypothetical protein